MKAVIINVTKGCSVFRHANYADSDFLGIRTDEGQYVFSGHEVFDNFPLEKKLEVLSNLIINARMCEEDELYSGEFTGDIFLSIAENEQILSLSYSDFSSPMRIEVVTSYLGEWAKDFCTDVGYMSRDIPAFIANNIDWDGVAQELIIDYNHYETGSDYHMHILTREE